jgi:hypothetical protein
LYSGDCSCCGKTVTAKPPADMPAGSPFGPGIVALVTYLHGCQMVSYARLAEMLEGLFGLKISEGAIANMLARPERRDLGARQGQDTLAVDVRRDDGRGSPDRPDGEHLAIAAPALKWIANDRCDERSKYAWSHGAYSRAFVVRVGRAASAAAVCMRRRFRRYTIPASAPVD